MILTTQYHLDTEPAGLIVKDSQLSSQPNYAEDNPEALESAIEQLKSKIEDPKSIERRKDSTALVMMR